jgi:RNA polymerase sigma factor (sigma-70 family)
MPPPPAELFASRIFLGPALRAQPDGRLVGLVREGYDSAFEEIVRRYRRPLERFAAAIVGGRCEDVTQDAFSKALLALRGSEAEIQLRPWLYRIVRNTALNDLRDRGPVPEQLSEALAGGASAAAEAERREELADLIKRLGALPEPQRAAIVMRELEGLSHEEIASALGVSGGAARQAIYRARAALRDGLGLLMPMPVLRVLIDHAGDAIRGGAVAAGASSAGGAIGGLGAGGALKVGAATLLLAGTLGAGVAIDHQRGGGRPDAAIAAPLVEKNSAQVRTRAQGDGGGSAADHRGPGGAGGNGRGESSGSGRGGPRSGGDLSDGTGTHSASDGTSDHSGSGSGGRHGGSGSSGSGGDDGGGLQSARSGDDGGGSSGGGSGGGDGSSGSGDGSISDDSSSSGSGGGETTTPSEPLAEEASGESGSGSGSDGSDGGSDDLSGSSSSALEVSP